ncbi:MAG: hypothetical protein GY754_34840 [bacterium]|nr:hypothetical protein [bacterium]
MATFLLSAPAMFASTYISADYLEILMSDKNYTATLSEVSTNPEKYENVCCFKFDNAMPGSLLENPLIGFDTKMYFEKRPSKRNDGGLAGVFHRTVPLLQQDWQENSHPVTVWLALAYAHYRDEEIMKDYKLRKYAIRVEREDRYFYNKAIQGDNSDSSSENKPNITVYLFKSLDEFISWKRSWTLFWTGLILFIWFVICINNYFSVRPKS